MKKILIVSSTYYKDISDNLKKNTIDYLNNKYNVTKIEVPGAFEIPVIISKEIDDYDGVIALGCIIKGETPHFDLISKTIIDAIMILSIKHKKPIGNGILTCFNKTQALERINKGVEAATAVDKVLKNESIT